MCRRARRRTRCRVRRRSAGRWLFRSSQPAASMPSRSFSHAGRRVRLTARGCLLASGTAADSAGWRMQVVGAENEDAGPVEQWSEESRKHRTASGCAMLSPVLTTRCGSRSSRPRIQDIRRCRRESGARPRYAAHAAAPSLAARRESRTGARRTSCARHGGVADSGGAEASSGWNEGSQSHHTWSTTPGMLPPPATGARFLGWSRG